MKIETGSRIALIACLFFVCALSRAGATPAATDLRCEYLVDPLGIDTREPRFSWKLVDAGQTRGQKQTAYRIVVERAGDDGAVVLWDTGKVRSGRSVNVVYRGGRLTSNLDCRWRVRVWDRDGMPTAWSKPARFSVGLSGPCPSTGPGTTGWKAKWIRHPGADEVKHIWFRKNFALESVPDRAFTHVCSIGYHELYVNGERIGTRVLSPAVSNLEKRALSVTYDIAQQLRAGDNVIAVWTGPGWARADGSYGKGVWKQDAIFKCQARVAEGMTLLTDESWKCRVSSSENLGLWKGGGQGEYGGELIDARRHVADWNTAAYDDRSWANASVRRKHLAVSAEMLEPDRMVETLKPVAMREKDGIYTFDMGRNFTGWLECDLRGGKEGDVVRFMTSNRKEEILEFKQESRYVHDASGTGTFRHRFNYMAGRWITVAGVSGRPAIDDLRCHIVTNDRKRTGSFRCSNALLNRIYETDLRTYIANTVNGVTMDCPHRERFGYGEIALACAWGCAIPHYESAAYYTKAARDWFDVQREDGFVNTIAPQVYKGAGGTLWSSAPVTLTWEFFKAYGDRRQLAEGYGPMKRWLDYLHGAVSEDGVLTAYEKASRFLGDWATPHGSEYGNTPEAKLFNNCVYAYCLGVLVQAAEVLGKLEDAKIYGARLEALRRNAHRHFFNGETGSYIDGRQLSMAFPLYTGITPESEREGVMRRFVEEIRDRKPYLDTGSSGLPILLKFMVEDAERADLLFPCLARTAHPGYGYFFEQGETTWPEYWQIEGHSSRIHTCYTGVAGYFTKAIGGIRPDPSAWGMQKFLVKPMLVGDLTFADTTSGTMYGKIVSNWRRTGTTGVFEIGVPPNTTATVFIPAGDPRDVRTGNGEPPAAGEARFLRMENGRAVFQVGSGNHQFTSTAVPPANPGNNGEEKAKRTGVPGSSD